MYIPEMPNRKSLIALMALGRLVDAKTINIKLLAVDDVKDISTFYEYYVLNTMSKPGNYTRDISFINEYREQ